MENMLSEPLVATYLHEKCRRLGIPVSGTFELTARCNFNCPMCYVHLSTDEVNKRGRELTAEEWISIAKQATDAGMMFALITGGEPFIRKDFFDIYSSMKSMGLLVSINTNGYLIRDDVLKRLLEDPPFRVNISLYGGCSETYLNMCGVDAFDSVTESIRALKSAGVDVRLNLSLTPYNRADIQRIYNLAKDLGIHVKFNAYMYPPLRTNDGVVRQGSRFTPKEAADAQFAWDKLYLSFDDLKKRCTNILKLSCFEQSDCMIDTDEGVHCRAGRSSFWVTWDGKLLPCGMMTSPTVSLNEKNFVDAWNDIRKMSESIRLPDKCVACPKRKVCNVCSAICVTETGDFNMVPDYMCKFTDELINNAQNFVDGTGED